MTGITQFRATALATILHVLVVVAFAHPAAAQDSTGHQRGTAASTKSVELGTSAAIDKDGRLWVATKEVADSGQFVALQISADMGKTWSAPRRIQQEPQPVAAAGEERPKIAFGPKGEVYIAYAKPVAKPHIGNIRFVRSVGGGRTFSKPVTVHANRDAIAHAFGSMIVDRTGRI